MKLKSTVLLCSIAILAVLLSSCTSAPSAPTTTTPPSTTPTIVTPTTVLSTEPPAEAFTVKEFSANKEIFLDTLNEALSAEGMGELTDPTISPGNTTELGVHTAYTYQIVAGAAIVFYVNDATENVLNITILTSDPDITGDSIYKLAFVSGIIVGGLSGDDAERIDGELNMGSFEEDSFAMAETDSTSFMYMTQGGTMVLMVTPV